MPDRTEKIEIEESVAKGAEEGFSKAFKGAQIFKSFVQGSKSLAKRQWEKEKAAVRKYWESDAVVAIRGFFSNTYNTIKGHIDEVLGPFKEVIDFVVESVKKVYTFFKGIFTSVFKKMFGIGKDNTGEEQVSWLKKLYKFMVGDAARRRKEAARVKGKKDDGFGFFEYGLIGAAILGLVALIGGFARSLILPFELIIKGIKQFKIVGIMMSKIAMFLSKIPILGKFIPIVSKFFGTIQKLFQGIGNILGKFGKLLTKIPILGGFLKSVSGALRLGFRVLGWPIAIIFGLIDFIRGFVKTQGSLVDKIKAGLQLAVMNFLELPVKLIGWMADKVLGWFGVKVEGGTASKMMKGLKWAVGFAVDMVVMLINGWKLIFEGIINFFKKEDSEGTSKLQKVINKISNIREMFINFINNMVQTALKKLERIPGFKTIKGLFFKDEEEHPKEKSLKERVKERIPNWIKERFIKDEEEHPKEKPLKEKVSEKIDKVKEDERKRQRQREEENRTKQQEQIDTSKELASKMNESNKTARESNVVMANAINNRQSSIDKGTDMEDDDNYLLSFLAYGILQ